MASSIFTEFLFLGLTLGFLGKILLGITVIRVHSHIVSERRIDLSVLKHMKRERVLGILGVIFMVIGYIFELLHHGYLL